MKNPEKTFRWITGLLQENGIEFMITGGMAARIYGAQRPLNDIDLDVSSAGFARLPHEVLDLATFGPARYTDHKWDLPLVTLVHEGQEIDISDADNTKIHDAASGQWISMAYDISKAQMHDVFSLRVPVIDPEDLMAYKSLLDGAHQKDDIAAIRQNIKRQAGA